MKTTHPTLYFSTATLHDLPTIVAIYNTTVASRMVTADTEPVSLESRQQWFDAHDETKRPLWVVKNTANEMVAWVSFQSFYGRPAYDATVEISVYVDELHRGKGIGKSILAYCIEHAPLFGAKTLLGFIFAHNLPSLNLFRYFGFEDWATLPNIALLDNEERDLKILGKRIG